jgi:hypothetical protein
MSTLKGRAEHALHERWLTIIGSLLSLVAIPVELAGG